MKGTPARLLLNGYVLLLSGGGFLLVTVLAIGEGFREPHIVIPTAVYFLLTFAGVVATLRPGLPVVVRRAAVAANVIALAVVIMVCVGFVTGALDFRGAAGLLFCSFIVGSYIAVLRVLRAREVFLVPDWVAAVVILATAVSMAAWISPGSVFPAVHRGPGLADYAEELRQLNRRASIAGAMHVVTLLIWAAFLPYGFLRARKPPPPRVMNDDEVIDDPVLQCPSCSHPYRLSDYRTDVNAIHCSRCKQELPRQSAAI